MDITHPWVGLPGMPAADSETVTSLLRAWRLQLVTGPESCDHMCVPVVPCHMLGMLGRSSPLLGLSFPIRKMGVGDVLSLEAPMIYNLQSGGPQRRGLGRWPQQRAGFPVRLQGNHEVRRRSHSSNQRETEASEGLSDLCSVSSSVLGLFFKASWGPSALVVS